MNRGKVSVLVVAAHAPAALLTALAGAELRLSTAPDGAAALARLEQELYDVLFVQLEGDAAFASIAALVNACAETPIVALGAEDAELVRRALSVGATDYLVWPSSAAALIALVDSVAQRSRALPPRASEQAMDSGLLGSSPQLTAARETLSRVARGTATVLVRGETGTGKELAARAIHAQSQRALGPFVKVHTPSVPDALLESELFGYEKGAFTGASARKPGRVELAEGGTLFLDEIGEISPTMQAKLLRLIQDREFERLGGTRTLRADIRVVAATHRDLEHLVDSGAFREDLFYRLNVVSLWLPPLRARREDILTIADHYLREFCRSNGKQVALGEDARRELAAERWPGNVRQLVNIVERLVVLATGEVITAEDVRRELTEQSAFLTQAAPLGMPAAAAALPPSEPPPLPSFPPPRPAPAQDFHFSSAVRPLKEDVRRTELRAITKALHFAKGNRALAARLLGVSRRTLYTKLAELGID